MTINTTNIYQNVKELIVDPEFKKLIPALNPEEKIQLEKNIVENGCLDSIKTWTGIIIDGHNRFEICSQNNIAFTTNELIINSREEVKEWIIKNQFGRRNISTYQRAVLALELEEVYKAKAKMNQGARTDISQISVKCLKPIDTQKELAKIANTSHDTIQKVKKIEQKATPETKQKIIEGKITINKAYQDISREEKKEEYHKKVEEKQKEAVINNEQKELPNFILADPSWEYNFEQSKNREIENHYDTCSIEEMKNHIPLHSDNCILFMWATAPKLIEAIELIKLWGFEYKTCAVWDKQTVGMGYWFRGQHELLLVATKGKVSPPIEDMRVSSIFSEKKTIHSKKPDCVYEWIEKAFALNIKLEMYCRKPRQGWQIWGNEV